MNRSEGNYMMAAAVRKTYADRAFRPAAIATAIDEVAKQGYRHYRVVQDLPFDLSGTDAAHALEEWLDREQFHYIWRPTFIEQDPFRPAIATEYPELVISW